MGHSKAAKAETHERVVRVASERFRSRGIDGISIADVMKDAGLTVGSFYKHFDAREDLVSEALSSAIGGWQARVEAAAAVGESVSLDALVDEYLSPAHRDQPENGCAVSALVCDVGRGGVREKAIFTDQISYSLDLLANLAKGGEGEARAEAMLQYSALVGALSLSRAIADDGLSREFLNSVACSLKARGA